MNGLDVSNFCGSDDVFDDQITLIGGCRANTDRFVGRFEVVGSPVGRTANGNRFDTHLATGSEHSQGDLAAIGNQDSLEHKAERFCVRRQTSSRMCFIRDEQAIQVRSNRQFEHTMDFNNLATGRVCQEPNFYIETAACQTQQRRHFGQEWL